MKRELAARLPDAPEWVEMRGILLSGRGELVGPPGPGPTDFVVQGTDFGLFCVSGTPELSGLGAELERHGGRAVLCPTGSAERVAAALTDWRPSRALVHVPSGASAVPAKRSVGAAVAMLSPANASLGHLPPVLRDEVETALGFTHVAAAFVGDRPVSFCYAGYETEKFWDLSIDTLEENRGRGHARECCEYMIEHMSRHGKEPVWGALESNVASRRLAASLGFEPVAELVLFEPPLAA